MWFYFYVLLLFVVGSAVGSFLNVVVMRTIDREDWVHGRSRCDYCKKVIPWYNNIPLLSYVLLRGRSACCGKRLSIQHPFVEGLVGSLFVWWGLIGMKFFQLTHMKFLRVLQPAYWLVIGLILVGVFVFDLFYMVIPDLFIFLGGAITIAYRVILVYTGDMQLMDFGMAVVASLANWLFFYALYLITKKKGMGLGDVYLAPLLGLVLGWPRLLPAMLVSFVSGSVVGLLLIVFGGKNLKSSLPFGPFMIFGTVIGLIWGRLLISYLY